MSNQVFANTSGNGVRYSPNVQQTDRLQSNPGSDGVLFTPITLPAYNAAPSLKYALGFDTLNGVLPTSKVVAGVTYYDYSAGQNDVTSQFYTVTAKSNFQSAAVVVTSLVDNVFAVNFCIPLGFVGSGQALIESWVAVYPPGYAATQAAAPWVPLATYGASTGSFTGFNSYKQPFTCNCIVPVPAGCSMAFEWVPDANIKIGTYLPWYVSADITKIN